jgi:two-component system, NarL family, nitrate/nitrite response regulator NarL
MKRETIAAVLVGPNALLREGLARILSSAGYRILASTSDIEAPLRNRLPAAQPILLIIDEGDDFAAALEQIRSFKQRCPLGRVAVLAYQNGLGKMVSAFRAGANAYLVRVAARETLIKSLELITLGVTLFPLEILSLIAQQEDPRFDRRPSGHTYPADQHQDDPGNGHRGDCANREVEAHSFAEQKGSFTPRLSVRQLSILNRLIEGASNKAIAREMAITEATVKVHVKAILRKIRVHSRTQAAIWAMSHGPLISAMNQALPDQAGAGIASTENEIVTGAWQAESGLNTLSTATGIDQPSPRPQTDDRLLKRPVKIAGCRAASVASISSTVAMGLAPDYATARTAIPEP